MEHYDICVIGGGPAGYAAAIRGVDFGKRVLLVEKDRVGGAGLFNGALSSKTLWELGRDFRKVNYKDRGYCVTHCEVDFQSIMAVMNQAVQERHNQLEYQLRYLEDEALPGYFRYAQGFGSMLSPNEVKISLNNGTEEVVWADHIILATGSRPRYIPGIPIDEKTIMTSDGLSSIDHFPESIVILGAGVIGCEFATIFASFGQSKVYLIDKANRILPFEDEDVTEIVAANLEKNGVVIHRQASLESMTIDDDGRVKYILAYPDGRTETHFVEKCLVSVGRVPNIENLGLSNVGLECDARGVLRITDTRTEVDNIFAVGDLTADICLVNVGEVEGRHAVELIYDEDTEELTYDNVSTIMFLAPEVAGVGMNEQQAKKRGIPYRVASYSYKYIGRAIAMRNTNGFFKILVTDDDEMRILGMRAVGEHASSTIQAVALLISMGKGINELADLIHPHPSITEGIQECMRMFKGTSIIKPRVFKDNLLCKRVVNGVAADFA